MLRSLNIKDTSIWGAQVEHRGAPLHIVTLGKDRLARLGQGGVYWVPICNSRIEFLSESDGCLVRDLELHGNDSRYPLLYEALSRACERVGAGSTGSFTRIKHG